MGEIKKSDPVVFFAGFMVKQGHKLNEYLEYLKDFGHVLGILGPVNFSNISDYYDEEMGENIQKYYFFTDKLFNPEELKELKIRSNHIEDKLMESDKRTVNFDVGYIALSKFVLASTKNFYHRIYLGKGIYAEITMYFKNKEFRWLPWTYKDYKEGTVMELLHHARAFLKEKIDENRS
ncbi:DUF4416 family protein [bacterium]|nr:DUF4416 family protein [bacterium]